MHKLLSLTVISISCAGLQNRRLSSKIFTGQSSQKFSYNYSAWRALILRAPAPTYAERKLARTRSPSVEAGLNHRLHRSNRQTRRRLFISALLLQSPRAIPDRQRDGAHAAWKHGQQRQRGHAKSLDPTSPSGTMASPATANRVS